MRTVNSCRACGYRELVDVVDHGNQHLSDFRLDDSRPPRFPLVLAVCPACTLAQLRHTAPPELLYHPNYSFKSGVSDGIRRDLADIAAYALREQPATRRWLDIASNDGTLLRYVPTDIWREGIDPLEQFADEARQRADRITVDFFHPDHFDEPFDVITSVSMFYDLDDPDTFVQGVEQVLAPGGIWVIQQNYAPAMLAANSADNISHEHLAYHTLATMQRLLARYDLEVVDVLLSDINGGCFRTLVTRKGERPISHNVRTQEHAEQDLGLEAYWAFSGRVTRLLSRLGELVTDINQSGGWVYVYGASTRGAVLWQAAGLDATDLPMVVDRNPAKVGRYMSAIGAPIISEEQMRADPPPYLLVGPWWLIDWFMERERAYLEQGGKFIVPVPEVRIIDRSDLVGWDEARARWVR